MDMLNCIKANVGFLCQLMAIVVDNVENDNNPDVLMIAVGVLLFIVNWCLQYLFGLIQIKPQPTDLDNKESVRK